MQFPVPPIMTSLPKLVETYGYVTADRNPFLIEDVTAYGVTAADLNGYMLLFYNDLPVMNNYVKLSGQVAITIKANAAKYAAMAAAATGIAAVDPTSEMNYTDTTVHTGTITDGMDGTETKTRSGNVADSGTDTTASDAQNPPTATDSTKTYDAAAFKEINKTVQTGATSLTHGKTTTYNNVADTTSFNDREDTRTFDDTVTRTITGHKKAPSELAAFYTDFVRQNNVFMEIINDVVKAISCIVYVPVESLNYETEE